MAEAPLTKANIMSMDEFIRRQDTDGPFELIDGAVVPKMPTVSTDAKVTKRVFLALLPFEQQGLGEVFQETTFVLSDEPQWVKGSRIPDVMFVGKARLAAFEKEIADWEHKPYILIPDLVVEVVSPTDNYSDINQKVRHYLDDGVRRVWLIDPQTRQIITYRQGSDQQTILTGDSILTAEDLLPGFALKVRELFD